MINIDTRILKTIDENEFWLLTHLVKYLGKSSSVWPSNKTLCKDTGWHIEKLQRVKKALLDKHILSIEVRFNASNLYRFHTKYVAIYNGIDGASLEEHLDGSAGKTDIPKSTGKTDSLSTGKTDNEVLTNEVLTNISSGEDFPKELFFEGSTKDKSVKKKKKEDSALFKLCVDHWLKIVHPMWTFKAVDGKALKSLIEQMREYSKKKNEIDPSDEKLFVFFQHLCLALPTFYKNQTLMVINSKFDSIIDEIRTGKPIQKRQSPAEYINSFKQGH